MSKKNHRYSFLLRVQLLLRTTEAYELIIIKNAKIDLKTSYKQLALN